MDVLKIYGLLKGDLDNVKKNFKTVVLKDASSESKVVFDYLLASQGKLIRPILVFLSAYLVKPSLSNEEYEKLVNCATAIELIHSASLVHDDIIDDAELRRNKQTIKTKFGVPTGVTMGVYLYSLSLQLIAEASSIPLLKDISQTVKAMCEGELLQLSNRHSSIITIDDYYSSLESKTAALFRCACNVGASLFGFSDTEKLGLDCYAMELGYVFQLTDDYLDMFGSDKDLNKKVGQDFFQGQYTLPIIFAMDRLNQVDKDRVLAAVNRGAMEDFYEVRSFLKELGVHDELYNVILARVNKSKQALHSFEDSEFKSALIFLVDYVFDRVKLDI